MRKVAVALAVKAVLAVVRVAALQRVASDLSRGVSHVRNRAMSQELSVKIAAKTGIAAKVAAVKGRAVNPDALKAVVKLDGQKAAVIQDGQKAVGRKVPVPAGPEGRMRAVRAGLKAVVQRGLPPEVPVKRVATAQRDRPAVAQRGQDIDIMSILM